MSRRDELRRLEREKAAVKWDLFELSDQVATAEIDRETGRRLEQGYRADLESLERRIDQTDTVPRSLSRAVAGVALLLAAFVAIGVFAVTSLEPRDDEPLVGATDLEQVSNEALEAVIAANADHPQINGMRLALANRYFEQPNFRSALPHYMAVLESSPDSQEGSLAWGRVGWMVYQSGGDPELAQEYLSNSVALNPSYQEGQLYLAMVLLYGLDQPGEALPLLDELADLADLTPEVRSLVEEARREATSGP